MKSSDDSEEEEYLQDGEIIDQDADEDNYDLQASPPESPQEGEKPKAAAAAAVPSQPVKKAFDDDSSDEEDGDNRMLDINKLGSDDKPEEDEEPAAADQDEDDNYSDDDQQEDELKDVGDLEGSKGLQRQSQEKNLDQVNMKDEDDQQFEESPRPKVSNVYKDMSD